MLLGLGIYWKLSAISLNKLLCVFYNLAPSSILVIHKFSLLITAPITIYTGHNLPFPLPLTVLFVHSVFSLWHYAFQLTLFIVEMYVTFLFSSSSFAYTGGLAVSFSCSFVFYSNSVIILKNNLWIPWRSYASVSLDSHGTFGGIIGLVLLVVLAFLYWNLHTDIYSSVMWGS